MGVPLQGVSVSGDGTCHPLGETRRSWKSKVPKDLPTALTGNRRF